MVPQTTETNFAKITQVAKRPEIPFLYLKWFMLYFTGKTYCHFALEPELRKRVMINLNHPPSGGSPRGLCGPLTLANDTQRPGNPSFRDSAAEKICTAATQSALGLDGISSLIPPYGAVSIPR